MNDNEFFSMSKSDEVKLPKKLQSLIDENPVFEGRKKVLNLSQEDIKEILHYIDIFEELEKHKLSNPEKYKEFRDGAFSHAVELLKEFGANDTELYRLFPPLNSKDIRINIVKIFQKYSHKESEIEILTTIGKFIGDEVTNYSGRRNRIDDSYDENQTYVEELETKSYDEHLEDIHQEAIPLHKLTKKGS